VIRPNNPTVTRAQRDGVSCSNPPVPDQERLAALEALVYQMRDELREVHHLVATLPARRQPIDDAAFLAAIAAAVGDHLFSARELVNHATVDTTLRAAVGIANAKQIGKRLRRMSGQRIGPYQVLWADRDSSGSIWKLDVTIDRRADQESR
jgi:hypothetical protein